MSGRSGVRVRVTRIDQSPLNARQWLIAYECGHEKWISTATPPKLGTWHICKNEEHE